MCAARSTRQSEASGIDGMINGIPIRKLYVFPIIPKMVESIKQYFQSFGELESFRIHTKDNFQYAFVRYASVEAAKAVLSKSKHLVGNLKLKVKPAHERNQPDHPDFEDSYDEDSDDDDDFYDSDGYYCNYLSD